MTSIGIEKLGVYPCSLALPMSRLCRERGHSEEEIRDQMMIDERSVNPLWEDPVTQAVNAAVPILNERDRERIELLIVATESGLDQEKALSSWVHRYLGLKPECRSFEIKQACYGGVAALQMACSWIESGTAGDAAALVITTDQSRPHFGKPWEYVMGAGAAAVLISNQAKLVVPERSLSGYLTEEVPDLMRPTSRVETGHSETSLLSYLDCLETAFALYWKKAGEPGDLDAWFDAYLYHAPFGGMTFRAHRSLLRSLKPEAARSARAHFEQKSEPALRYIRRMGGTYSSSPFIGLAGLLAPGTRLAGGDRIGIFSYGSGACAEYFSVQVCDGFQAPPGVDELATRLDQRYALSVGEYEQIETRRSEWVDCGDYRVDTDSPDGWYRAGYEGRELLIYEGVDNFVRRYRWS